MVTNNGKSGIFESVFRCDESDIFRDVAGYCGDESEL